MKPEMPAAEIESLRSQLAEATAAWYDRDNRLMAAEARLADLEAERYLIVQRAENAEAALEADFEVYHQVYMVLLNAGTNKQLGALEQAQALVVRLADSEANLERLQQRWATRPVTDDLQIKLAEAEALLREESHEHYRFTQMTEYPSVTRMLLWHMDRKSRIDAHLSRNG